LSRGPRLWRSPAAAEWEGARTRGPGGIEALNRGFQGRGFLDNWDGNLVFADHGQGKLAEIVRALPLGGSKTGLQAIAQVLREAVADIDQPGEELVLGHRKIAG